MTGQVPQVVRMLFSTLMHSTPMKSSIIRTSLIAALACSLALTGGVVLAKEGGDQYPNGGETWFAGAVPPPGNYFINYTGHWSGKLKDANGDNDARFGPTPKMEATFNAFRFLQVSDRKLLGGNWGWHVIVPVVDLNIDIAPMGGKAGKTGLGDITVNPLIISWHHSKEWHTVVGLDINLPTGEYDKNDPRKSIGANYYSFEPVFGVSYLGGNGWEASAKFMYNIKTENKDTDYKSGNEFHMDYLVGRNFGKWGLGVNGYYLKQVTDDKDRLNLGRAPNGYRGQVFAIGPSVKYRTEGGTHIIGQWQHETHVENRFGGDKVWVKLIVPL